MVCGSIYAYAGNQIPSGFLLCDGSAVSRSVYSDLFSVIGTSFGSGDGSTTFSLPDISGKVAIGTSQQRQLGYTGGSETVILDDNSMPAHTHEVPQHSHQSAVTVSTPSLSHTVTQPAFKYNRPNQTASTIYTASSGSNAYAGTTSSTATRSADAKIDDHPATACTKTGSISDCGSMTTSSVGDGNAHNNMQPYLVLKYIIYAGV
jgi:microcystin-dependent protein